jgi:hypothetical protein
VAFLVGAALFAMFVVALVSQPFRLFLRLLIDQLGSLF